MGEEPGPATAPTDKLLFTVQIYDCFYGPNRKAARFMVANGAGVVGGGLETHTSTPPPHSSTWTCSTFWEHWVRVGGVRRKGWVMEGGRADGRPWKG